MISNVPFLKVLQSHKTPVTWQQFIELSPDEQLQYYCARIRRSLTRLVKLPFEKQEKLKTIYSRISDGYKLRSSDIIILPHMVDLTLFIYNGKTYQKLKITKNMVGKYIGAFRLTRKKPTHTKVTKKKAPTGKKG